MSARDMHRVEVMGRVKAGTLRLAEAAMLLAVSYRQVKRIWQRYRTGGAKALVHRHVGHVSNRGRLGAERTRVLRLVREKYSGDITTRFGPTLAAEHLASEDGIVIDHETLRRWMLTDGLWSRRRTRSPYRQQAAERITATINYDGRPDFASNPYNGPQPSEEQMVARACTPALLPRCFRNTTATAGLYNTGSVMAKSYQSSIGVQRHVGDTMAIEVDYVYNGTRDSATGVDQNLNVIWNPAAGTPSITPTNARPFPWWDLVVFRLNDNLANLHSLQMAWTKRMSGGWQASGNYTLSGLWDRYARPVQWTGTGFDQVPFSTAPDLGGEDGLGATDQRHRAVFNGIWQLPYSFQLSGMYFFGSGERYETRYGVDVRNLGGVGELTRIIREGADFGRSAW